MEKACNLCLELRPVVYCKADAAKLCLSCDAKVHSANTIVDCHPRILLCGSCRYRSAEVQCFDHRMFMCCVCDLSLHRNSSQHEKRTIISSYTGCPSAKEFAAFWGFKLNESGDVGSSDQRYKISLGGQCQKSSTSNSFILDQILDLERLKLSEGDLLSICSDQDQQSEKSSERFEDKLDHHYPHLQHSQNSLGSTRSQQRKSRLATETRESALAQDLKVDPSPFPSSSDVGFASYTESFWQGRSPVQSGQLWSQNMQDLGVCEELAYHDDPNYTPDVDSTFRNFEDSFGGDRDVSYSFVEKKEVLSLNKSNKGRARAKQYNDQNHSTGFWFQQR